MEKRKRCYYWKVYKYCVPAEAFTLKGWIEWCTELYEIQHGHPRTGKIFIDPEMQVAMVKGRVWNKDAIEKWLNDHGYNWTCRVETRFQFKTEGMTDVLYVDADPAVEDRPKGA